MYRCSYIASYLSCGGDKQTKALYGNIDCDTHACKSQVTLPHDGLESFVMGLRKEYKKEKEYGGYYNHRKQKCHPVFTVFVYERQNTLFLLFMYNSDIMCTKRIFIDTLKFLKTTVLTCVVTSTHLVLQQG